MVTEATDNGWRKAHSKADAAARQHAQLRQKVLLGAAIVLLLMIFLGLLIAIAQAESGQIVGTEAGGNGPCITENLPAGEWVLIGFDDAGQVCDTKSDETQTCNPNATWDWSVSGIATFTSPPGYARVVVELQLWAGYNGGACHGGSADPVVCDNPDSHWLMQDFTEEIDQPTNFSRVLGNFSSPVDPGNGPHDLVIPWQMLFYQIPPGSPNPGSDYAGYSGFWLFAKSLGRPAICKSLTYHDLVYEDGPSS